MFMLDCVWMFIVHIMPFNGLYCFFFLASGVYVFDITLCSSERTSISGVYVNICKCVMSA